MAWCCWVGSSRILRDSGATFKHPGLFDCEDSSFKHRTTLIFLTFTNKIHKSLTRCNQPLIINKPYICFGSFLIERSEHQKFQIMNDILYNKLNKKLDHLWHKKTQLAKQQSSKNTNTNITFHTRVQNMSDVKFNREEELLLKLGLNYALEKPTKNYLQNLISLSLSGNSLPFTEQEIS